MSARRDVAFVMTEFRYSERQACKLLDLDRSSYRYEARPEPIEARKLPGGTPEELSVEADWFAKI